MNAERLAYPTMDEVLAVVENLEPATAEQIRVGLGCPWEHRGTVWHRLMALLEDGAIISDEGRPVRFAVNQL